MSTFLRMATDTKELGAKTNIMERASSITQLEAGTKEIGKIVNIMA